MAEEPEKYSPKGVLRALIIAPTRELALQVLARIFSIFHNCQILDCYSEVYIFAL